MIISNIRYLARQGISLRGDGDEKDSNLYQLLLLRGKYNYGIKPMLEKTQFKYISPEKQNELLSVMVSKILRNIVAVLLCRHGR